MKHQKWITHRFIKPGRLSIIWLMALVAGCHSHAEQEITMERLLDEMVSFDQPSLYPDPYYTCKQVSSYDRRSVSPGASGWFANDDGFGCVSADTVDGTVRQVLFDEAGPGVITRIWITTSNKKGTFKFYFDGAAEPGWIINGYDLGKTGLPVPDGLVVRHMHYKEPLEATGGNTFFLPVPYASHCRIVFESPADMGRTPRYYQINYRTYPAGTHVRTFNPGEVKMLASRLEQVGKTLQHPELPDGRLIEKTVMTPSGGSVLLECPDGEKAVQKLWFRVKTADSSLFAGVMRKLVVKMQFDGKETVWVPLSDFSGGGMGAPEVRSWYLDSDGAGNVVSRWVMPYRKEASIELHNYSGYEVEATIGVSVKKYRWDNKRSLYFHAGWKQETGIRLSNRYDSVEECSEWRFAGIKGRGVYAGDLLSLFNHSPAWYGEGDEKIWVDNDPFPSHFGTGTEDYYNCSWAPVVPFHTPFGGAPRADLPSSHGYNAFFRTRNLDVIPFRGKFIFDIEMLSWQKGTADYAATIYWYGDADAQATGCSGEDEVKRDLLPPPPDPAGYKISNSLEFEDMEVTGKSPSIHTGIQSTTGFDGKWSRAAHLLATGGKPGDYLDFRVGQLESRPYRISIYATKATDYGVISFSVNGKKPTVFDGYHPAVVHAGPVPLGTFTPENGSITLQVKILATNKNATGAKYMFGLDCMVIN